MLAIVVSDADSASVAIGERLLDLAEWETRTDDSRPAAAGGGTYYRLPAGDGGRGKNGAERRGDDRGRTDAVELRTFDDLHLDLVDAADAFDNPDLLVFASRHAGETGPLLTAHVTGNFGEAEYGGEAGSFARAAPNAQKAVLGALDAHAPEGYAVGIECTHHGPTRVGAPAMFVELGSGPDQWTDPAGAGAVARAVLSLRGVPADRLDYGIDGGSGVAAPSDAGDDHAGGDHAGDDHATAEPRTRHVVGFGGSHYAPRFERVLRETDWAVGHVGADWQLNELGHPRERRDVLRRAFEASAADLALVEGDYPILREVLADLGYRVVSESFLRAVAGVPLDVVEALEERLRPVEEGLRFGAGARVDSGRDPVDPADLDVVALPDELLTEAQGIDADAAREAVAATAVAFETVENGTRARGRAAVEAGGREALVEALAAVLGESYDDVERRADAVVARTEAFDPGLAHERGVPEGPAFGRLAAGEAVEVDGERIDPEAVRSERVERFPI